MSISYTNPEIDDPKVGNEVYLPYGVGPLPSEFHNKKIFYFDIDNCLYTKSTMIHDLMTIKISQFFRDHLKLSDEDARLLHQNYYQQYGLALEGLVRNHKVDALEYNSKVDDAIDLKSVLHYDSDLRNLLISIKKNFDFFWLVTNAYKNHALRVISFLGVGDLFDGLTYCDYSKVPIVCKPQSKYFYNVLDLTNIDDLGLKNQFYIDDSEVNVKAAFKLGFGHIIHFVEHKCDLEIIKNKPDFYQFYGNGDNSDPNKIKILTRILDLESIL